MTSWRRRTALYLGTIAAVMAGYTVVYDYGMGAFEGEPVTTLHALQVVVETMTTTGYGADAPWPSTGMVLLVVAMQLTGVALIFLALPAFVVPLLGEVFSTSVPTAVDRDDHVVICGFGPRDEVLVDELGARGVDYVVIEPDADAARDLYDRDFTVIEGDPESDDALGAASVSDARAVVIDAGDETNATVALSVREVAPSVRIVSYAEDPDHREYLEYAGADAVISPRQVLGRSIANQVTSAVTTDLGDTVEIGADFEVVELPVQDGSDLDGVRLADSAIRERTGANVIGAWFGGEFTPNPSPDRRVDSRTALLVTGTEAQLARLGDLTRSSERRHVRDRVIVAGCGEVGSTARDVIEAAGITTTTIDVRDDPDVDVVGDATDAETLRCAGAAAASAVIVALGDDTTTIFTTLVAREVAPDVEVITRAADAEAVSKLYAAGADYVLALSTVSGRMLVAEVFEEDVVSFETQIEIVRTRVPSLAGQTLAGADVRSRTGCTVIAVERGDEVVTDLGPAFEIRAGDSLVVAGTDEDVRQFADLAGASARPA